MKKILVINNGTAGLFGFRRELLTELCKGCSVTVVAKNNGRTEELAEMGCKLIDAEIEFHGKNPLQDLNLIRLFKRILRAEKPDIVLTYTIKPNVYGGIACASLRVPFVANITGLGVAVENGGLMQKITVPLYRFGLRKAQKVFFQNEENMKFMLDRRMISGDYELIPGSGVNLERFQLLDYPQGDTVDFSFISRVMKEKGIDQYLAAAKAIRAKHPEAVFHIYGMCTEAYKTVLQEQQDAGNIIYHGYTKDVIGVHRQSACTIHPSYYPEGMSNVLLESAASGRPVITTDRAGCRETVEDGVTGYMIRKQNSQDLIDAVEKFLALTWEERRQMGIAGRRKVEREFDRNIVVNKYLAEVEKA